MIIQIDSKPLCQAMQSTQSLKSLTRALRKALQSFALLREADGKFPIETRHIVLFRRNELLQFCSKFWIAQQCERIKMRRCCD